MADTAFKEPLIDTAKADQIISSYSKIIDLNLESMKPSEVEFSSTYEINFTHSHTFHGLVSWFDTPFDSVENKVNLSTSPYRAYTHWKHVTFYIDEPFGVKKGDKLSGSIAVRKSKTNFRELDVKISYHF
jgi:hypothetical protein